MWYGFSLRLQQWRFRFLLTLVLQGAVLHSVPVYAAKSYKGQKTITRLKGAKQSLSKSGRMKWKYYNKAGQKLASFTMNDIHPQIADKIKHRIQPPKGGVGTKGSLPDKAHIPGMKAGDHKGHASPEAGVADKRLVNILENLSAQNGKVNLGEKKRLENSVVKFANANPAGIVTFTTTMTRDHTLRPITYTHVMKVNGQAKSPDLAKFPNASIQIQNP